MDPLGKNTSNKKAIAAMVVVGVFNFPLFFCPTLSY